ncbi:MAG TPA: hypothetical protein VMM35_06960 [Longimicrobiales bacterium]|nr:hypothetical protein [Longimicrobiales bacterium]
MPVGVEARQDSGAERAYLRAVARYFQMPESEVSILAHWDLPTEEIPVALFLARRAGVSAEAIVALRESGRTWTSLTSTYNIGANALHVPLRDPTTAGTLRGVYERFRDTPVGEWGVIRLSESDIVTLVNVRVLSDALGVAPDEIARRTAGTASFVELYAQLLR